MKTDLLPVTAGDEEYCLSRLRRRNSAEKYRMSKDCSQGTSNWCIGISFVFFRQMVRVNTGNDEYIT